VGARYQAVDAIMDAQRRTTTSNGELAKRMGISLASLYRILLAEHSPRIDSIARAAEAMGYRLDLRFVKERAPRYEAPTDAKTVTTKTRSAKPVAKATTRKSRGAA
jgi:transcriptional regulator with XRE-family HTH domain